MSEKTTFEEMSNEQLNYEIAIRLGYKELVANRYSRSGWTHLVKNKAIPYLVDRESVPDFTSGHLPFIYHICDEVRKRYNVEAYIRWDTEGRKWTCAIYTDGVDLLVSDELLGRAVVRAFLEYDDAVSAV